MSSSHPRAAPAPPRQRPRKRAGRRPGESGTRAAILAAATRHFAQRGYDRASLRAIAAEAGVDHRLIVHFFGSKQRLFVAAVGLPLDPAEIVPRILAGDRAGLGERVEEFVLAVLERPEIHARLAGVVRAAASEPQVARMLREFLGRELFARAAELIGRDDGALRVNLAAAQLVGLIVARYVVGVEPLASLPPATVAPRVARAITSHLVDPL